MYYGNYLMHYGVKGMHWGVRHDKERSPYSVGRRAKDATKTYVSGKRYNSRRAAYKRSKAMTDEELKRANKRLNAEKQYRELIREDAKAGRSTAESILSKNGNMFIKAATGAAVGTGGAMAGKAALKAAQNIDIRRLIMFIGAR